MKTNSVSMNGQLQVDIFIILIFLMSCFMISPISVLAQSELTQKNKKLVVDFFTLAFVDKKKEEKKRLNDTINNLPKVESKKQVSP